MIAASSLRISFLSFLTCGVVSTVSAELLVYEPFDYAVNSDEVYGLLEGRDGGKGFKAPWVDVGGAEDGSAFVYGVGGNPDGTIGGSNTAGKLTWDGKVNNLPSMGGYIGSSGFNNGDRLNSTRKLAKSAGEMAAENGGVLWMSSVWHFTSFAYFAPVAVALTDGGGFHSRAARMTDKANSIGTGNGKNFRSGWKRLNAMCFKDGNESSGTAGFDVSQDKDNIVVLKFEFGETDKVSVAYFTEDEEFAEKTFDERAVSCTTEIDESKLDTLAFGTILRENAVDEFRIGTTFDSVFSGSISPRQPVSLKRQAYKKANDTYAIEINSNPGESYGIYVDIEGADNLPCVNPELLANRDGATTVFGPFKNPFPGNSELKFKIGNPDRFPPLLQRVWGVDSTISLHFSEPIESKSSTNLSNYKVTTSNGENIPIKSAKLASAQNLVYLTPVSPLAQGTTFHIEVDGIADLATLPLENGKSEFKTWSIDPMGIPVFIVAGQSNMVGRGRFDKGQNEEVGGIGSLRYYAKKYPEKYGHLLNDDGTWKAIENINFMHNSGARAMSEITKKDGFGPEFGFAHAIRKHFGDEPVLIIKTAWGGKSLYKDFSPPTAASRKGTEVGFFYNKMLENIQQSLADRVEKFPEYEGKGYYFAGMAWHQGFNDMLREDTSIEYEENLVDFIKDVRRELSSPGLPFAIATTGHGGMKITVKERPLLGGQMNVADPELYPEFAGNVMTSDTRPFQREPSESPRADGSHWNYNGETYWLIGKHLGDDMVKMLKSK